MVARSSKKVIFCNSFTLLRRDINKYDGRGKYVLLNYNKRIFRVKKLLDDSNKYSEIGIKSFSLWKAQYLRKFVETMGCVNIANHKQYFWWGLSFTNKNPLITPLCDAVYYALFIAKVIEEDFDGEYLFVIGKDNDILKQLKIWFEGKDVEFRVIRSLQIQKQDLKDVVRKYTPVAVFFAAARAFIRKMQVGQIKLDTKAKHTVALSLLNHQSFQHGGGYSDTYFGKFVPYAAQKNAPLINLFFVNSPDYGTMMRKIRKAKTGFVLMPLEYFLSALDIMKCLFISLRRYFFGLSLIGDYSIDGKSVNHLINAAIRREFRATYFYDNIRIYYEIKNLVKKVSVKKFFYPFENQAFEKLVLLVLRRYSSETRAVGYQHPSLSLRHTNFLLTKQEAEITPLPDKIMTMGDVTKEFMSTRGNFPDHILTRGCALRQKQPSGDVKNKRNISNIVVLLASNSEEYIKVIAFLNKALKIPNPYTVWLRPHPVFPLSDAIEIAGKPQFSYYESDKETLDECLAWADVAVYVHSTSSIESLSRGLPVICLNIDNVISPDPLFSFTDFRWRAESPQDLVKIIDEINALSENEFYERQKKAVAYTEKYFYPVNEESMDIFLKV
jgi:hypothetical protein